jgi:hypothetical protein
MNYGLRTAVVAPALIENREEKVTGLVFGILIRCNRRAMACIQPATSFYSPMPLLNRLVRLTTSFVSFTD